MSEGLFTDKGEVNTDALPSLPYAGTSGHSGSDTSRERAVRQDRDGTTTVRQSRILARLAEVGSHGITWKELADRYDWHHGQASGALSTLHKDGHIARLAKVRRLRCAVYVLHTYVGDRETAPHGRQETEKDREIARLRGLLREVQVGEYVTVGLALRIADALDETTDTD